MAKVRILPSSARTRPVNFSPGLSTCPRLARRKETVKVKGTDLTGDLWITGGIAPV